MMQYLLSNDTFLLATPYWSSYLVEKPSEQRDSRKFFLGSISTTPIFFLNVRRDKIYDYFYRSHETPKLPYRCIPVGWSQSSYTSSSSSECYSII